MEEGRRQQRMLRSRDDVQEEDNHNNDVEDEGDESRYKHDDKHPSNMHRFYLLDGLASPTTCDVIAAELEHVGGGGGGGWQGGIGFGGPTSPRNGGTGGGPITSPWNGGTGGGSITSPRNGSTGGGPITLPQNGGGHTAPSVDVHNMIVPKDKFEYYLL